MINVNRPLATTVTKGAARLALAAAAAVFAFLCYHATLLPGLDFGDSASFQTGIGTLTLTPRQAYPLYYALGNVVAWLDPREPAHAMNLASALYGAGAVGLMVVLGSDLTGSAIGGLTSALLLAISYTFWSQAITAEVYTLHILIVTATLIALFAWEVAPTRRRLALFYALYALGFGNHLSMVLMLPGLVLFLLVARRAGDGDPLVPRNIALAITMAIAGALQYLWNFRGEWSEIEPPSSIGEAIGKFWFDVTKSDWRETIVMGLSESGLRSRPEMYWWDVRQQFGVGGAVLAAVGLVYLAARWPRRALLLATLYLVALAFAWTYNVGDAYIFFLPSHHIIALCAGAGLALFTRTSSLIPRNSSLIPLTSYLITITAVSYPLWRAYDDFPALDRSRDSRAAELLDQATSRPNELASCRDIIFGLDGNWQMQNAVEYYMRERKPGTPWFTTLDFPWLAPENRGSFARFVDGNSRPVVVTAAALRTIRRRDPLAPEPLAQAAGPALADAVASLTGDLFYALAVLREDPEFPVDRAELESAWRQLTNGGAPPLRIGDYTIAAGRLREPPQITRSEGRPFRLKTNVRSLPLDVRMESWLPTDTIRRSGFGHVVVNRTHLLTIERGVSLVVFDASGRPILVTYRGGLFAPLTRWVFGTIGTDGAPCYR